MEEQGNKRQERTGKKRSRVEKNGLKRERNGCKRDESEGKETERKGKGEGKGKTFDCGYVPELARHFIFFNLSVTNPADF